MPQLFQLQQGCPDVFADFPVVFKVGTIAGIYYGIPVPLQIDFVLLSAGNLGGHKIRIRKDDANGIALKILNAADFYLLAYISAKPVKL